MESAPVSRSERDRFLQAVRDELLRFEQREIEFRRRDRKQRATEIGLPLAAAVARPDAGTADP